MLLLLLLLRLKLLLLLLLLLDEALQQAAGRMGQRAVVREDGATCKRVRTRQPRGRLGRARRTEAAQIVHRRFG